MMYLKDSGEKVNIIGIIYVDEISVAYHGVDYPVISRLKVEDIHGAWDDYVRPSEVVSHPSEVGNWDDTEEFEYEN